MSFDELFDGLERRYQTYERPGVVWKNSISDIEEEEDSSGGSNDGNDPGEGEYSGSAAEDSGLAEELILNRGSCLE